MDNNNSNNSGNSNNFNFDPSLFSNPNFQYFMQMMNSNFPTPNMPNPNFPNPTFPNSTFPYPAPYTSQQINSQFVNETQNYHTSQQNTFSENPTEPYFSILGGQNIANEIRSEEGDNDIDDDEVEEVPPAIIEPILTPLVVRRSKKNNTNVTQKSSTGNMAWSVREEEAVISCYMEHCTDATIGTNQTAAQLWRNVAASYEQARLSRPLELPERSTSSIRNRWGRMSKDVLKWAGYIEEAARSKRSGEIDDDVKTLAHINFKRNEGSNFVFENAFEKLQKFPKWQTKINRYLPRKLKVQPTESGEESNPNSSESGKRIRLDDDDDVVADGVATSGGGFMSGGIVRPEGVKKAKAKKFKGKGIKSSSDEQSMSIGDIIQCHNEIRRVDLNLQKERFEFEKEKERRRLRQLELDEQALVMEREHRQAETLKVKWDILQNLLAKTHLTQEDEAFKNNLMRDIYGNNNN